MPPRRTAQKADKEDEISTTYPKGGRNWLSVVNDPELNDSTRNLAANFINNRIAYYYNVTRMITVYMNAKNIPYRPSSYYVWSKCADLLYDALLKRAKRKLFE